MKHTPGPWTTYAHTKGVDIIRDDSEAGQDIATARTANDAALIAAAPDLLELARQIVLAADQGEGNTPADIVFNARATLARLELAQ